MKVLGNTTLVKKDNANLPFGSGIQNETESQEGTQVVAEFLQDPIMNLYRLIELAKITPTGDFDSDTTQYQIIDALKKLPNSMNDIEQVLDLDGLVWSVPFDLSILPNKYFFIARASEDYVGGRAYTFKGTGVTEYTFVSSGFKSSEELIVIIDSTSVRAYSINSIGASGGIEFLSLLSSPISFNDGSKMMYYESGKLLTDTPSVVDLEVILRSNTSESTLILNEVFYIGGFLLCFCLIPGSNTYLFRQFAIDDLATSLPVTVEGASFDDADDFAPYVYVSGSSIYVTNSLNSSADDFDISKLNYDPSDATLTHVSEVSINNTFVKTTNAVIKSGVLYTMISGTLNRFNLTTGVKTLFGNFPIVSGQIFWFNSSIYYSAGNVAHKWL